MRSSTRTGQAYVDLTVDGSGVNEDIVDAVDEAGPGVGRAGERQGDRFGDEFGEALNERLEPIMERLGDEMSRRLGRSVRDGLNRTVNNTAANGLGARLGDALSEGLTDRLESRFAELADDMEARLSAVSGNSGGSSGGGGRGAGPGSPSFPSQGPDPDRDRAVWEAAHAMNVAFDRRRTQMLAAAERMDEQFMRQRGIMVERALEMNERFDRAQGLMVERALRMNEDHDRRQGIMIDRARSMNEAFDRAQYRMLERAHEMNERFDRDRGILLDRAYRENDRFDHARGRMIDRAYEMNEQFDRDRHAMIRRAYAQNDAYDRARTRMLEQAYRMNREHSEGRRDGAGYIIPGGGGNSGGTTDIGRYFGMGSRNNALHLLGKSMSGIMKLTTGFGKLAKTAFSTFQQGAAGAAAGASTAQRAMAGMSAVATRMGASGAAAAKGAAAALPALIVALSILVSVGSALLAIVTALASTIASALAGAAIVGAAALGTLAAAGGLVAIAFTSMTNAQQEMLSKAFTPLKEMVTGIGQLMLGPMVGAFSTWSSNLQRALLPLAGYAERFGQAFARAGNIITASFSGPGFTQFIDALGRYLPSIITGLSRAFGGFMNGLLSIFAVVMPYVSAFARHLANVGAKFRDWAASAEGQNAIKDFVDRAVNSLIFLWNATKQVMGFISDLLFSPEAQNAGNTIFEGIWRTFIGFREWLAEAAASGDLRRWFEDGIQFGAAFWGMLKGLGKMMVSLYDSGVIDAIAGGMGAMGQVFGALAVVLGPVVDVLGYVLPVALAAALSPLMLAASAVIALGEAVEWVGGLVGWGNGSEFSSALGPLNILKDLASSPFTRNPAAAAAPDSGFTLPNIEMPQMGNFSIGSLIGSGRDALNATYEEDGGYMPDPTDQWVNPYVKYAESLIQKGPTIARQIKQAMASINKDVNRALNDAAKAANAGEVKQGLTAVMDSMRANIEGVVSAARSDLESAANSLAGATSQADANQALREISRAQGALNKAITAQYKVQAAARTLARQRVVNMGNVRQLLWGARVESATLADYAAARERMAAKLEKANQKLVDAISLRDEYKKAVADAVRTFGAITTATAKTIDGVEQALTADDIVSNLEDRLKQIRTFQANLRILLAQGLSNAAYKQLVDAGVEGGSAYAQALVDGGAGAVREVNGLTSQIDQAANALGGTAANRMYQAGVDAARGLVNGLESLSGRLDRAAARLGDSIARQIKRSLGIKSPSTVMIESMGYVGDGLVKGLDAQQRKVGMAADSLSRHIAVSPEVAAYAARKGTPATDETVSGNQADPRFRDLIVHTPTEDPEGVAREVLNEVTGRL